MTNSKTASQALACAIALSLLTACGQSTTATSTSATSGSGSGYTYSSGGTSTTSTTGSSSTTPTATGTVTPTTPWASGRLANGDVHSCNIDLNASVWCWGHNANGQLGDGNTADAYYTTQVTGLPTGAQAIAAGGNHSCALLQDFSVWCWGSNTNGELGNGGTTDSSVPVQVQGLSSAVALSVGISHSCAVDTSGKLWCWGANNYGQLGNGTTTESHTPVQVTGFSAGAKALALGARHSCATDANGLLYCWGYNGSGRLGDGTTTNRTTPTQVASIVRPVTTLAAGYIHTCALDSGSQLWCWGSNADGQLGNGSTTSSSVPVQVLTLPIGVQSIALGGWHSCVTDGQSVACWGFSHDGQVGNGSTSTQLYPILLSGIPAPVRYLAAGGYHTCTISSGQMDCWGNGYYGQLASGSNANELSPTAVASH